MDKNAELQPPKSPLVTGAKGVVMRSRRSAVS